jgi:signal peptidase I
MTTLVAVGTVAGLFLASFLGTAGLLFAGARLARIPNVRFRRALLTVVLFNAVGLACYAIVRVSRAEDRFPLLAVALFLGGMFATWKIIQRSFSTSLGRAILAWLPTLLVLPALWLLVALVTRPILLEFYEVPTNGMAPTIVGEHGTATCPRCGGTLIVSAQAIERPQSEELGICVACLKISLASVPPGEPIGGDRIVAFKTLTPRRWDLAVFHPPIDRSTVYVKRLVGLPGEEIAIRDGEVWINGQVVAKPAELAGLEYTAQPEANPFEDRYRPTTWGAVRLGDDEYFMLGDFSAHSADSRHWAVGAPGHPPYAVPESDLIGVATHIYWPPSRWRVFR